MAQIEIKGIRGRHQEGRWPTWRRVHTIPGTVYGGEGRAFSIAVGEKELMGAL